MSDPYVRNMLDELTKANESLQQAATMLISARDDLRYAGYRKALSEDEYQKIDDLTEPKNAVLKICDSIDEIIANFRKDDSNVQQE